VKILGGGSSLWGEGAEGASTLLAALDVMLDMESFGLVSATSSTSSWKRGF